MSSLRLSTYLFKDELEQILKSLKILELENSENLENFQKEIDEIDDGEYICNLSLGHEIISYNEEWRLI